MMQPTKFRQRGATLLVVMVILIAMTWFVISGYRLSSQHLQIVGNSQARQQALAAAQRAIEETISSNATPIETDIDGDGVPDFEAVLSPAPGCYRVRNVKTSELDISDAGDRVCLQSTSGGGGVVVAQANPLPTSAGNSLCAKTEWDVAARVDDRRSGTSLTIHQGVAIRTEATNASNFCK
ncbi:MAG: hypothetical protein E6H67_15780 [Betaproteobacteria bacterium]|nr:MAG: hypothetical protein E6H67_15780 [Betaproteobacteria bacterium]